MFGMDKALPPLDGEHDLNIDLGVGVRHGRKMPLLTELENLFLAVLQRGSAYGAAEAQARHIKVGTIIDALVLNPIIFKKAVKEL